METRKNSDLILSELKQVMDRVDNAVAEQLLSAVLSARRVFVAGCGRSGLAARAFAMRLVHLGWSAFVVGETTTPAIAAGDLLIVCSGKGDKTSLGSFMQEAARAGARRVVITSAPTSPAAEQADLCVVLPAAESRQFGGSLFEQALLLFLDGLVMEIIGQRGISHDEMAGRHANLE